MGKSSDSLVAVISGDIVDSTSFSSSEFEEVLACIKKTQSYIKIENSVNSHSIERGDEFQSVVHDFENALRYTLLYRLGIKALGKKFDCRISFSIAPQGDLREFVSESMGKAFTLSGRGLKAMKNERLVFHSDNHAHIEQFSLLIKYLDRQITELTSRQCEVMLPLLKKSDSISFVELAEELQVSNATVSKSLKAAGWTLIEELIYHFHNAVIEKKHV